MGHVRRHLERGEPPIHVLGNTDYLGLHSAGSRDTGHGEGAHQTREDDAKCEGFDRPFKLSSLTAEETR